jgi:hypothetical protein
VTLIEPVAEFLGDEDEVKAAMNKVRAETKTQMWARDIRMLLRRNDWGGNTKDRIEETWRPSGTVTIGRHLLRLPSFPTALVSPLFLDVFSSTEHLSFPKHSLLEKLID